MDIRDPDKVITKQDLKNFYDAILPYLGGSGHAILDKNGDELTQRDALSPIFPLVAKDNDTDEHTELEVDTNADFSDVPVPAYVPHTLDGVQLVGFTPCGTVISYFGETAPEGYLVCDGTAYSKTEYPNLWALLSSLTDTTPYIVDGDNTKFKVPDLRGEFLRGTGINSHTDQGSGQNVGVHGDATNLPAYGMTNDGKLIYQTPSETIYQTNPDSGLNPSVGSENIGRYYAYNGSSWATTSSVLITTRPTNTSVLYCIAYKDIYIGADQKYSETERIVGTWIDGKPIYQKSIKVVYADMEAIVGETHGKKYPLASSGLSIDIVLDCEYSMGRTYQSVDILRNGSVSPNMTIVVKADPNGIYMRTGTDIEHYLSNIVFTLRYTKTTD